MLDGCKPIISLTIVDRRSEPNDWEKERDICFTFSNPNCFSIPVTQTRETQTFPFMFSLYTGIWIEGEQADERICMV